MVFDAVSRCSSGVLSLALFREALGDAQPMEQSPVSGEGFSTIRETVDALIESAMKKSGGNRSAAARLLGISPQALGQRLKRTGWN